MAVGANGYGWSSSPWSPGSYNGGRFRFDADEVQPVHNTPRSYALTVRCVQASASKLFFCAPDVAFPPPYDFFLIEKR